MTTHLRRDLENLERKLLIVASLVEESLRNAIVSLLDRRLDLAQKVIEADREIDRREVELEEDCLKVLALHQPVATDLRFVTACLKIDNDLERIGDLATNIAETAISLADKPSVPIPLEFREMMEQCVRMVRNATNAFVKGDAILARQVCDEDDIVDRADERITAGLIEFIGEDSSRAEPAVALALVSRDLERVADHATNIGEDVIYLVQGAIVRHQGRA